MPVMLNGKELLEHLSKKSEEELNAVVGCILIEGFDMSSMKGEDRPTTLKTDEEFEAFKNLPNKQIAEIAKAEAEDEEVEGLWDDFYYTWMNKVYDGMEDAAREAAKQAAAK